MNQSATQIRSQWAQFFRSPWDWLLVAGLLSALPLMAVQSSYLWSRPHFQFFPSAWIFFLAILVSRGVVSDAMNGIRTYIGVVFIHLSVLVVATAVVLNSPWLAHVSVMLLITGWMLKRLAHVEWPTVLTWSSIVLVTLPLPLKLDEVLIQQLQLLSSQSAGRVLDLVGINHLLWGNVIELRSGKLFVDQACSGIDSLYALLAVSLIFIVYKKQSFVTAMLALATVPFWAWFGNVLRLVVITYCEDRLSINLLTGWQHSLLGLVTFAVAFSSLIATNHFIVLVLKPMPVGRLSSTWAHKTYNWIVKWPYFSRGEKSSEVQQATEVLVNKENDNSGRSSVYVWGLTGVLLLVGLCSIGPVFLLGPWKPSARLVLPSLDRGLVESTFNRECMPEELDGLKLLDFKVTKRERGDVLGEYSATWFYRNAERNVTISLDFPFPGYHELEICYQLAGSRVVGEMRDLDIMSSNGQQYVREGEISDAFDERTQIYYMEFTADAKCYKGTTSLFDRIVPPTLHSPMFQLQIAVGNARGLGEKEHSEFRDVLLKSQAILLPVIQNMK